MQRDSQNILATWSEIVDTVVKQLHEQFVASPGMILTEGDLECTFHRHLIQHNSFSQPVQTLSYDEFGRPYMSNGVISQVTWFKNKEDWTKRKFSGYEVDISICDPALLVIEILQTPYYPNKGFFYDSESLAIELKFIRWVKNSGAAVEDIFKINNLLNEREIHQINITPIEKLFCFSIVFCKTSEIYHRGMSIFEKNKNKITFRNKIKYIIAGPAEDLFFTQII